MKYFLSQFEWDARGEGWQLPAGAVATVDLRSLAASATPQTPIGHAIFATDGEIPGTFLGDSLDANFDAAGATAWNNAFGWTPKGTVLDALWDQLTVRADPTGQNGPKPIMPDRRGTLRLRIAGSAARTAKSPRSGPVWEKIRQTHQHDYRQLSGRNLKAARSWLGYLGRKWGVPDPENYFVPDDLPKLAPLRPGTVVSDDFERADSSNLGANWTEVQGDLEIVSGEVQSVSDATTSVGRWASDLGGDDQVATATVGTIDEGTGGDARASVLARFSSSAYTAYFTRLLHDDFFGASVQLRKVIAGTETNLDQAIGVGATISAGATFDCEVDGSSQEGRYLGTTLSATDTAISGHLRAGFYTHHASGSTAALAAWQTDDNVGGGGGGAMPMAAHHHRKRRR